MVCVQKKKWQYVSNKVSSEECWVCTHAHKFSKHCVTSLMDLPEPRFCLPEPRFVMAIHHSNGIGFHKCMSLFGTRAVVSLPVSHNHIFFSCIQLVVYCKHKLVPKHTDYKWTSGLQIPTSMFLITYSSLRHWANWGESFLVQRQRTTETIAVWRIYSVNIRTIDEHSNSGDPKTVQPLCLKFCLSRLLKLCSVS